MRKLIALAALIAGTLNCSMNYAEQIDTHQHPSLGDPSAKVQVVAFLEPKCPDSKRYNNQSFPTLKKDYIDTKKIQYTVITTSFLPQSMPAAIALLCVYNQEPSNPHADLFFKYLDYIYEVQPPERQDWATSETLLKFAAKASKDIDQNKLKSCIESEHYKEQIVKNTAYGNQLMGKLHTPTIFVNGVQIKNSNDTIDYGNLKIAIDKALKAPK